jgi:hypothetical protein
LENFACFVVEEMTIVLGKKNTGTRNLNNVGGLRVVLLLVLGYALQ